MYRSRVRTEPTNVTAPQFTAALWTRLEIMIEEMADCCVKVCDVPLFRFFFFLSIDGAKAKSTSIEDRGHMRLD
jgi:hypothetical protein